MKLERWQQVEKLYHATLERAAADRADFLTTACAGDDSLRAEVESLLAYQDQSEDFIETPALDVAAKMMAQRQDATVVAGEAINQYTIISPLGVGGMGEVYLAEDTRLKRRVALKFLPTAFTLDKTHLRRFEQEARSVAALSHPNVCTIHEVIETAQGRNCIVMEYADGATLRQRIAQGRMNTGEALDIAVQVASALATAHAAGVIHRDVKPENVIIRRDGYVKVLDFGLAKLIEKEPEPFDSGDQTRRLELKTTPGIVLGTVAYMSPEQARGLPVDARTDIWSLGVVLYEMVAGRQPFEGATATDVIISIAGREPQPLTQSGSAVPIQLERILNKALAKEPSDRYQTAEELLVDLKSLKRELEIGAEVERFGQATPSSGSATMRNSNVLPFQLTRRHSLMLSTGIGVLIIAGLFAVIFFRRSWTPASANEIKSLAVLPLENLSGDASQDYFADGMTESLITDLAKIGALRVISRPSVMQYKTVHKPLSEIGRELNVDALLTGSVVRSGDRVRIAVQLVQVATDQNLWSESYERDLSDVLALQRGVTRDIVGKIRIKLSPQEQVQFGNVGPINPEAYDHYLRGQYFLNRQNKEDNAAAITELERAVTADPTFAAAQAELAQAYVWKLFLFAPEDKQWAEKAFVAAEKALSLDPNLAGAYLARGRLLWTPANHFPHEKAIGEYRRALTLNPSLDEARNQLALVYCHIGAFDEALRESREAVKTNPNNNLAQLRIGQTLNFQGKYEQALSVLRAIPQQANPALVGYQIAWSLFNLGKRDEASALVDQLLKDNPEDSGGLFTSVHAVMAASARKKRVAEDEIRSAIEKGKGFGHFHHTAYNIACAYALMNKPEQAVKWLEFAAEDGFPCYPLFERDTNLDSLRKNGRFIAFLEKQRKQWEYYKTIL